VDDPLDDARLPAADHQQREVADAPGEQCRRRGEQPSAGASIVAGTKRDAQGLSAEAEQRERPEQHRLAGLLAGVQPEPRGERRQGADQDGCAQEGTHGPAGRLLASERRGFRPLGIASNWVLSFGVTPE
jgi:hypothetical protein